MTAKPGPWWVVERGIHHFFVTNHEAGIELTVCAVKYREDKEWAERIAARLNSTEGDER